VRETIDNFSRPFYYLPHGETESNPSRLNAGSLDVHLTDLGRQQARAAAAALADVPITGVYSSPLRRARETAQPVAEALKLPVTVIEEIAERNWGELEGRPRHLAVRGVTPPGGEPTEDFTQRVLCGFARIETDVPLIVAHSGVFRVLCVTLYIVRTEGPIHNALPLRFSPVPGGGWKLEEA
jgi:probable phosphoglycerate mutase